MITSRGIRALLHIVEATDKGMPKVVVFVMSLFFIWCLIAASIAIGALLFSWLGAL